MKFAGLFVKYLLAAALVIPSFASAQESPPDMNAPGPGLNDPAMEPLHESGPGDGAISHPSNAPAPNAAAQELGEVKKEKKKHKKSAKKEVKKSKKADKHHKKDSKKAKKHSKKKKKHSDM